MTKQFCRLAYRRFYWQSTFIGVAIRKQRIATWTYKPEELK